MHITGLSNPQYQSPHTSSNAATGIREQLTRLEQNVAEVAQGESGASLDSGSREPALVEQGQIVRAVLANVRSLEASNQAIGTILDIKV